MRENGYVSAMAVKKAGKRQYVLKIETNIFNWGKNKSHKDFRRSNVFTQRLAMCCNFIKSK